MPATGSTFIRRSIGTRLRRLRQEAGLSITDVAATRILARSSVHELEAGTRGVRQNTVTSLCWLYKASEADMADLQRLALSSDSLGWYEPYNDVSKGLTLLLGAEEVATGVSAFDPEIVPGVLQTLDYARALFQGEDRRRTPEVVDRMTSLRQERVTRFWALDGRRVQAIIGEAALRREVGSRETMDRQLDHLRELSRRGAADVRILAFTAGPHPALYGPFTIFDFRDPNDPPVAYTEGYSGGTYVEEPYDIDNLRSVFVRTQALSTPIEELP